MKSYVVGFIFNESKSLVLLIQKTRPEWQRGRLNGIGGKIDEGETASECMERKCREECGLSDLKWVKYAELHGNWGAQQDGEPFEVMFFYATTIGLHLAKSLTEETVQIYRVSELTKWLLQNEVEDHYSPVNKPIVNIPWLVSMAQCHEYDMTHVWKIKETY